MLNEITCGARPLKHMIAVLTPQRLANPVAPIALCRVWGYYEEWRMKKKGKKDAFFRYAKLVLHTGRSRESYKPSIYWSNVVQANLDDVFRLPLFLLRSREKKRKKKRYD